MSNNDPREIIVDPPIRGVWEDEYPTEYDRFAVEKVMDEKIAAAIGSPSINGLLLDNTVPLGKLRDLGGVKHTKVMEFNAGSLSPTNNITAPIFLQTGYLVQFIFSGTMYVTTAGGVNGWLVYFDTTYIGSSVMFFNNLGVHTTTPPRSLWVKNVIPGSHQMLVQLYNINGFAASDVNDCVYLDMVEYPKLGDT
jgi:hypothetical protein